MRKIDALHWALVLESRRGYAMAEAEMENDEIAVESEGSEE